MRDEIDYIRACSTFLKVINAAGKRGTRLNQTNMIGFAADMGDYTNAC